MNQLETALNAAVAEQTRPERLFALFLSTRLEKQGHTPTPDDMKKLETAYFMLVAGERVEGLELDCADEASLVITDSDINAFVKAVPIAVKAAVESTIEHLAGFTTEEIPASREIADVVRENQAELVDLLRDIWGEAFDGLLALAQLSAELCDSSNTAGRQKTRNKAFTDAVTRLHARGCLISREIVLLLENGLSQAAQARWRALHEVTVIAMFIAKHKNPAAVRFLASAAIDNKRHLDSYEKHLVALGQTPVPAQERKRIDRTFATAVRKYGKHFNSDYGWAAHFLKNPRPNFSDLEASVDLDHYRPWYKAASMQVHGSARGLLAPMGLSEDALLTGPHFEIVPETALHTLNCLMVLSSISLGVAINVDRLVAAQILVSRGDEVREALSTAVAMADQAAETPYGD